MNAPFPGVNPSYSRAYAPDSRVTHPYSLANGSYPRVNTSFPRADAPFTRVNAPVSRVKAAHSRVYAVVTKVSSPRLVMRRIGLSCPIIQAAMSRRRTIHAQGDLDGACFLYSAANAYSALTGRKPNLARWARAIQNVPHPADFLDPTCGTTLNYEQDPNLLGHALETIFDAVATDGPRIDFTWHPEAAEYTDVAELVDNRSVALFRYMGNTRYARDMDHWVCGVATRRRTIERPLRIYVACSSRWIEAYPESRFLYRERQHATGRWSNDVVVDDGRSTFVTGCAFQLRLAPLRVQVHPRLTTSNLRRRPRPQATGD